MIVDVMRECRNFFLDGDPIEGEFTIDGDALSPNDGILVEQYVAVVGSVFHDGVWLCIGGSLIGSMNCSESFDGKVYPLRPPMSFIRLCEKIEEFVEKNPASAVASETFGNYSRSMVTGDNGVISWQQAFAKELNPYRRMFSGVSL